jgi:hypothetical protein
MDESARILPAEIEGDLMYSGGLILCRGKSLGDWNGHEIFEWWPIQPEDRHLFKEE